MNVLIGLIASLVENPHFGNETQFASVIAIQFPHATFTTKPDERDGSTESPIPLSSQSQMFTSFGSPLIAHRIEFDRIAKAISLVFLEII
jgi:hypothetical protein